ncbi:hypothetical protein HZS_6968 [Henneguya salminicola]|nr:hypothetical protein HZS_6968 [Henneguya salminicola]
MTSAITRDTQSYYNLPPTVSDSDKIVFKQQERKDLFSNINGEYFLKIYSAFCSLNLIGIKHLQETNHQRIEDLLKSIQSKNKYNRLTFFDFNANVYPNEHKNLCCALKFSKNICEKINGAVRDIESLMVYPFPITKKISKVCKRIVNSDYYVGPSSIK